MTGLEPCFYFRLYTHWRLRRGLIVNRFADFELENRLAQRRQDQFTREFDGDV